MLTRYQIKGALGQLGWAQAKLARKVGVSNNAMSAFLREKNPTDMGSDKVRRIEEVLLAAGAEFGDPNWVNVPGNKGKTET